MYFGCSKEPSYWDGSSEYPQHMFWLRNKKIILYALLTKGMYIYSLLLKTAIFNKIWINIFSFPLKKQNILHTINNQIMSIIILCILETPKQVLWHTVKTLMKCHLRVLCQYGIPSGSSLPAKVLIYRYPDCKELMGWCLLPTFLSNFNADCVWLLTVCWLLTVSDCWLCLNL